VTSVASGAWSSRLLAQGKRDEALETFGLIRGKNVRAPVRSR
jgi:hypothetical protein